VDKVRAVSIYNLPPPPEGLTGWPWTKESRPVPPLMPNGNPWPKISIVTPSYNQGQFLEETIRSVLLQNYPNLEYIMMDGGSTDNSVEIIKKYEPWLSFWVSERDSGQAAAIQRGFGIANGDIFCWINSDDYLMANAFISVAKQFSNTPQVSLLVGGHLLIRENGRPLSKRYSFPQGFDSLLCAGQFFGQMASFWPREAFLGVGGIDTTLKFCFDYDLFLKMTKENSPGKLNKIVAAFRLHNASKSSTIWEDIGKEEWLLLQERHGISDISLTKRNEILQETRFRLDRTNKLGCLKDVIVDPVFLLRTIPNRLHAAVRRKFTIK